MVLPIKKTSIYAGLASLSGVIKADDTTLEIEYQKMDEIFGMYKSDVETIRLNLSELEKLEVKKRWFSKYLCIHVKTLKSVGKFPNVDGNCIRLKIKSDDIEKAKSLTSRLMLELSEHKLQQLDSELNEPEPDSSERYTESDISNPSESSQNKSSGLKNMLRQKEDS